jgi:DNA-binding transcriptional ArsR family regulator
VGELVAGQPALRIQTTLSLPLDMVSVLSLLHRAVPGSNLDPVLVEMRASLPPDVVANLDLLHGFSGRLLFYPEEPVMRFDPLRAEHHEASLEDLIEFMSALPATEFRAMAAHALQRVHTDLELRWREPSDEESWKRALAPALTSARFSEVLPLIAEPEELKRLTIELYQRVWELLYRDTRARELPILREAAQTGATFVDRGFSEAYAALTGQRVPEVLDRPPPTITRIAFCPSAHLGGFVSYIAYEPDLIVYFAAPQLLERCEGRAKGGLSPQQNLYRSDALIDQSELLEVARALADPTRLRMIDLLLEGELYAQEIVGRLGVAQSAASRHLAQLERAGLVTVEARRGSKFYAVNPTRLEAVASALAGRGEQARRRAG